MAEKYSWFDAENSPWPTNKQSTKLTELGLEIVDDQPSETERALTATALLAQENAKIAELETRSQALQEEKLLLQKKLQAQSEYDALKLKTEINVARARQRAMKEQFMLDKTTPEIPPPYINLTRTPLKLPDELELPAVPNANIHPETPDYSHSTHQSTAVNDIVKRQIELSELIPSQQRRSLLPQVELSKFNGDVSQYRTFIKAFENRIEKYASDDADKLHFLCQYTTGDPKEIVKSCMHMEPSIGFERAKQLLQERFGNVYKITADYMNSLLKWPPMKADNYVQLKKFSQKLLTCLNAMSEVQYLTDLNNPQNLKALMDKLPYYLQDRWRRKAHGLGNATFKHFVNFVCEEIDILSNPIFGRNMDSVSSPIPHNKPTPRNLFATGVDRTMKCFFCCGNHEIDVCHEFLKLSYDEKRSFARQNRLCYGCLGKFHDSRNCRKKKTCGKPHPTALHSDNLTRNNQNVPHISNGCANLPDEEMDLMMSIVPAYLQNPENNVSTKIYMFMDPGSSGCILTKNVYSKLQAQGIETSIYLGTMHGQTNVDSLIVKNLKIVSLNGDCSIDLPQSYVLDDIPVSKSKIPRSETLKRWTYLKDVYLPKFCPDMEIGLLIGTNCPQALEALEVIPSQGKGPYAVLTRLGWTVVGPVSERQPTVICCKYVV